MTGPFSPEYDEAVMADAQQAAADKAVGDVVADMCLDFCKQSGAVHLNGTTALQDVDPNVVHAAFKLPELG